MGDEDEEVLMYCSDVSVEEHEDRIGCTIKFEFEKGNPYFTNRTLTKTVFWEDDICVKEGLVFLYYVFVYLAIFLLLNIRVCTVKSAFALILTRRANSIISSHSVNTFQRITTEFYLTLYLSYNNNRCTIDWKEGMDLTSLTSGITENECKCCLYII